ncbi:novel immune-type receptor 9 [Colossoma macropomum]|uniref:novel immune-type receptor 9 n=1 Tax=Colossoma macropomum TaxID=42526 RepID=UPI0018645401|nr:novel immune-type receptor 9 [Colossoma macropomum]
MFRRHTVGSPCSHFFSVTLFILHAFFLVFPRVFSANVYEEAEKMLTIGIFFLLCPMNLVKTHKSSQQDGALVFIKEGDSITIACHYQSEMAMHFSWYKNKLGQKPELISTIYKYDVKATFYGEFRNNTRFNMVNGKGVTHMVITDLRLSDSGTYYCGSAHSNIVEFGEGTQLVVRALQLHSLSVLQQPTLQPVHPGDSVTLECTVLSESSSRQHSVYWFRHGSGESHPGIIYTHGNRSDECKKSSEADSPTQSCVYKLPKRNLSLSDAGTYYCAVAMCGEIIFGNGTMLNINSNGVDCSEQMHILVLLSIIRTAVFFLSVGVIIIYHCVSQRANTMRSDSLLLSRESTKKNTLPDCKKNSC